MSILIQSTNNYAKKWSIAGISLASSCLLSYNKDHVSASALVQKIAHATNTDAQDLVDATTLGLYCWAKSFLFPLDLEHMHTDPNTAMAFMPLLILNKRQAFNIRYKATITPLIHIIATSALWNTFIKKIPILHTLACSNNTCAGVCDACEYTYLIRKIPFELIYPLIKKKIRSDNPTSTDAGYDLGTMLVYLTIAQPLWIFLRKNNTPLYRIIMALYSFNPLYHRHTQCLNNSCTSICNRCKLKKLYT